MVEPESARVVLSSTSTVPGTVLMLLVIVWALSVSVPAWTSIVPLLLIASVPFVAKLELPSTLIVPRFFRVLPVPLRVLVPEISQIPPLSLVNAASIDTSPMMVPKLSTVTVPVLEDIASPEAEPASILPPDWLVTVAVPVASWLIGITGLLTVPSPDTSPLLVMVIFPLPVDSASMPMPAVTLPTLVIDTLPPSCAVPLMPSATAVMLEPAFVWTVTLPVPQVNALMPSPAAAVMTASLVTLTLPDTLPLGVLEPPGR